MKEFRVVKMKVNSTSYNDSVNKILKWARNKESKYICAANVHMVMESYDSPEFNKVVNSADMVTPDGMPLVWMLRRAGVKNQTRVCGPDLSLLVCKEAENQGIPVGFYGGTPENNEKLFHYLSENYPRLEITCMISPPFRSLTMEEEIKYINQINQSGTRILFVGLGCPKQEKWMFHHKNKISAVMIGIGAAFNFHSGDLKRAPKILQSLGLEWLFRFIMEPKRLWKRYLKHNPRFLYLAIKQLITK
jgi:N-acetylglucosaminyldiphosphoundecaprenol N-acetyl-beta-D-mannosaminyltransferase